jgi:hypothetical protein
VWHLLRNLNHPNLGVKLLELDPPKGLGEKVGELISSSKQLLMKWNLMRICLLRSWKMGIFAKAKADLLSTLSSTASASLPR